MDWDTVTVTAEMVAGRPPTMSEAPRKQARKTLDAALGGAAYELFLPQYTGNATTVLTWKPSDKARLPAPTELRATRVENEVELSWKPVTEAIGWQIERRTLEPAGWSAWKKSAEVSHAAWRDTVSSPAPRAYRLRARGADGAASDWSKTSHLR